MTDIETRIDDRGTKRWYQNGLLHRTDGPAVIYPNGEKCWFQNGQRHRTDGPAIIYADGEEYYFIKGKDITDDVNLWIKETNQFEPSLFALRFCGS